MQIKKHQQILLRKCFIFRSPTEYTSNELLEDLQRIYRLKAIINDYGNKAVRDIQNLQKTTKK